MSTSSRRICLLYIFFLSNLVMTLGMQCSGIRPSFRFDCYPETGSNQQNCNKRGCCWLPPPRNDRVLEGVPFCFYPRDFPSYRMDSLKQTDFGYSLNLTRTTKSYYEKDVMQLQMDVYYETAQRLHFKIYDPKVKRYEVPITTPKVAKRAPLTEYNVQFSKSPLGILVTRAKDSTVLFNSSVSTLIFSDQFLQISTSLSTQFIYGLGEHRGRFRLSSDWKTYSMWARDQPPKVGANLYGSHPFYLNLEGSSGRSHGVFLLNSNAMEVAIQPAPALTYRSIGGILDFYIFLGPGPDEVIQQYTEVIGHPFMPPYWGLGFHLCRWGYGSANKTLAVVKKMKAAGIPQDTQWNDIDYMEGHRDFTLDRTSFQGLPEVVKYLHSNDQHYVMIIDTQWSDIEYAVGRKDFTFNNNTYAELPDLIQYCHANGMHFIPIVDPAISSTQAPGTYSPYDAGIVGDVFVKNSSGKPLVGKVWPGETVFPDFFNEKTKSWWFDQIKDFHAQIHFDGIWIDMNEPSSFVDGSVDGCADTLFDNPPYTPSILDGKLSAKTICASATHCIGRHYDLHNLYGYSEAVATNSALVKVREKRSFVISRSTYPGSGKYAGHWLGDNYSLWPDMAYSIAGIMSFSLFGIPLVGADICGFNLNTSEELCQRWMQLGAFYPFSRNHNTLGSKDQDPTAFSDDMQSSTRKALNLRYALLPYIYTLFHFAHVKGSTVARPLFFEFPDDSKLYDVDRQFMLGPAVVITPVLEEGATAVNGTFPKGRWYNIVQGNYFRVNNTEIVELKADPSEINVHLREGFILAMQYNSTETTTTAFRQSLFTIVVGVSDDGNGKGELYWDDGDSLETYESEKYLSVVFTSSKCSLNSKILHNNYPGSNEMNIGSILLMGVLNKPSSVKLNDTSVMFHYDTNIQNLSIGNLDVPLQYDFLLEWL